MSERMRISEESCTPGLGRERQELRDRLYPEYYHMVRRYFAAHLNCTQDVEDLTQNVFARLFRCKRTPEDPRTYILAVARNELRSYWHEGRRENEQVAAMATVLCRERSTEKLALDLDPFSHLQRVEEHQMIEEAIRRLPPALACVLRMRIMNGLSLTETAQKIGCSYDVVKKRLQRARRLLVEFWRQMDDGQV